MNRPKQIGTAAESGVVKVARASGFPNAERRALAGSADVGDVLLAPGLVAEVKAGAQAKSASLGQIDEWLRETERERQNARADVALLVVQRKGYSPSRAEYWDCWLRLSDVVYAAGDANRCHPSVADAAVMMRLDHALHLLRESGYGDPLPVPRPTGLTISQRPDMVGLTHSRARCGGPEVSA